MAAMCFVKHRAGLKVATEFFAGHRDNFLIRYRQYVIKKHSL